MKRLFSFLALALLIAGSARAATPGYLTSALGIDDGTEDGVGLLRLVNSSTPEVLKTAGVNETGAGNIVQFRVEHGQFHRVTQLELLPYVEDGDLASLVSYGRSHGFLLSLDAAFTPASCPGPGMTLDEVSKRFLLSTDHVSLGRYEIHERTRDCTHQGCSPWAITDAGRVSPAARGRAELTQDGTGVFVTLSGESAGGVSLNSVCAHVGSRDFICDPSKLSNGQFAPILGQVLQFSGYVSGHCLRFTAAARSGNTEQWREAEWALLGKY